MLWESLDRSSGLVTPAEMAGRQERQAAAWSHLKALAEPVPTGVQAFLREALEAGDREPLVIEVLSSAIAVHEQVMSTLPKPVGSDHEFKLLLTAMALTTLLLEETATAQLYAAFPPAHLWLMENGAERIAIGLDVGAGKTALAVALFALAFRCLAEDPEQRGPMARGGLYTASEVELLCGFRDRLVAAGVPEGLIGLVYSEETEKKKSPRYPSIRHQDVELYPFLLVTQSKLQSASAEDLRGGPRYGIGLDDLLLFRNRRRVCIWDEAFTSCIADALSINQLREVAALLQMAYEPPEILGKPICTLKECNEIGVALRELADAVAASPEVAKRKASPSPVWIPPVVEEKAAVLAQLHKAYEHQRNEGHAEVVESLLGMTAAGGLDPIVAGGEGERLQHLIRPRVVISPKLTRLAVLNADYATSKVAAMESTLRAPAFEAVAGKELVVKTYENVTVNFYPGPSGRSARRNEGLDNPYERRRMIRAQVKRVLQTPSERSLFVTFKKRAGGPDFVGEISDELDRKCPDWRRPVVGMDGSESSFHAICTWGQHRGINNFADFTNVLPVGLLTRTWMSSNAGSSARTTVIGMTHGDLSAANEVNQYGVEIDLLVTELIQAGGRAQMRVTLDGKAGRTVLHVYFTERRAPFLGQAPSPGSPMWEEVSRRLPGATLNTTTSRARGFRQVVADAAIRALAELPAEQDSITSRDLRPLIEQQLGEEASAALASNVLADALTEANKSLLKSFENGDIGKGWIRPEKSRTWKRITAEEFRASSA